MTKSTFLFGALAIVGTALPLAQLLPWLMENGLNRELFSQGLFASPISSFFAWDVIISGVVLVCLILSEGRRLQMNWLWLPITAGVLVGVSCGLPMFLAMRSRILHDTERSLN